MADTALLIDSTTLVPPELIPRYNITVIPVPIYAGGKEYRDGIDITAEEFCGLLETLPQRPQTAVPGLGELAGYYHQLLSQHRNVVYLVPSYKLTGLFNAAIQAAKQMDHVKVVAIDPPHEWEGQVQAVQSQDPQLEETLLKIGSGPAPVIAVMNTGFASGGTALIGIEAAKAIEQGKTLDRVLGAMVDAKRRTGLFFILNSLQYVVDRVGRLRALLGALLQIKPVLTFVDGDIEDAARVRGWSKARSVMIELARRRLGDAEADVFVLHSLAPAEAAEFLAEVRRQLRVRTAYVGAIGSAVSRYTGRGGLGLAFLQLRSTI